MMEEVRITLRLPADLAACLRSLAARNDRSLNSELVRAIRTYAERAKEVERGGDE